MGQEQNELLNIADKLNLFIEQNNQKIDFTGIKALEEKAIEVGKAWSGSCLGYHAFVYYDNFETPPPGCHFSSEWGLKKTFSLGSTGDWIEYNPETIENYIRSQAGNPDLSVIESAAKKATKLFNSEKSEILSIISEKLSYADDTFLDGLKDEIAELQILPLNAVRQQFIKRGQMITRDQLAIGQGLKIPPHIAVISEVLSLQLPLNACEELENLARKTGSHVSRKERNQKRYDLVGTNVFIGHGRSNTWRELKDFIQDRLRLEFDEFNRVPVAGITNIARLSEMLESATIAFLVMTGEDEQMDGKLHARLNVVHEAGLFQGRLGFTRAIVLLEDGCEDFSNIHGLGQIRFPKGNIAGAFEEIRRVLERENIISSDIKFA